MKFVNLLNRENNIYLQTKLIRTVLNNEFLFKRGSSVSIVSRLRDGRLKKVRGKEFFSLRHRVQTSSGAYPASSIMGTGASFPRAKAAGSWN
jgi:hypothetical protein